MENMHNDVREQRVQVLVYIQILKRRKKVRLNTRTLVAVITLDYFTTLHKC